MKLSDLKVNGSAVEGGHWVDAVPVPGVDLKVRGFLSTAAKRTRERLIGEIPFYKRVQGLAAEDIATVETGVLAHAILLDWRGLDEEYPGPQRVAELLADPDYLILRNAVSVAAQVVDNLRSEETKADEKNSSTLSSGASNGGSEPNGSNGDTKKPASRRPRSPAGRKSESAS